MQESESSDLKAYPTCKICDRGTLEPRKIRRLSGPAVAIGYILLVPSILGMVGCAILLIITVLAGAAGAAGVAHGSALVIAFAGIGSLVILYVAVVCFVGGLLGWLLVMRKYVLQVDNCGAVVNAAASVAALSSNDPWTTVTARGVIVGVLFLLFFIGIIWASIGQAGNSGSIRPTPTTTTAEPAQPLPSSSTAEPAQPSPDNTAAAPAISDTWLPFTSVAGRFSALFPGTLHFGSEPTHWKNGEPGTLYKVFAVTPDGKPNQTGYVVMYTDFTGDAAAEDAQTHLQNIENDFLGNKTRLGEQAIDLDGVPGRAITASDAEYNYTAHDFVAGTRFYWVIVVTPKGYTASQANRFLNSFRILDNPPTAVDNSTASSEAPASEPAPGPTVKSSVEILSDTMGVDFSQYIQQVSAATKRAWYPIIPEEARPPLNKQGEVAIRFEIYPDGSVHVMQLYGSSGDVALDRAAQGAITGASPYPPLPKQFKGKYLALQFNFLYN